MRRYDIDHSVGVSATNVLLCAPITDTRYPIPDVRCQMPDVRRYRLSVIGYRVSVIGYRLSGIRVSGIGSVPLPLDVPLIALTFAIDPHERSLLGHAPEIFARERFLPLLSRDTIRTCSRLDENPAIVVPVLHRHVMIAAARGLHDDSPRLRKKLQCELRISA